MENIGNRRRMELIYICEDLKERHKKLTKEKLDVMIFMDEAIKIYDEREAKLKKDIMLQKFTYLKKEYKNLLSEEELDELKKKNRAMSNKVYYKNNAEKQKERIREYRKDPVKRARENENKRILRLKKKNDGKK